MKRKINSRKWEDWFSVWVFSWFSDLGTHLTHIGSFVNVSTGKSKLSPWRSISMGGASSSVCLKINPKKISNIQPKVRIFGAFTQKHSMKIIKAWKFDTRNRCNCGQNVEQVYKSHIKYVFMKCEVNVLFILKSV